MGVYCKNRMLIISLALAASGILTCGLALSDIFLPRGSALVVLVSIPARGSRIGRVDHLRVDLRTVGPSRLPSRSKADGSQAEQALADRQRPRADPARIDADARRAEAAVPLRPLNRTIP